jgi:hypothetical protein
MDPEDQADISYGNSEGSRKTHDVDGYEQAMKITTAQ